METTDIIWILVFIVLLRMACHFSKKWYDNFVSPLSVFIGMNSISMMFYHLRLIPLDPVSLYVHAILITSFASFFIAAFITTRKYQIRDVTDGGNSNNSFSISFVFYVTAFISTAGWTFQLYTLFRNYGFSFQSLWVLQNEFQMQFIGYCNVIGILVLPLYILKAKYSKWRFMDAIFVLSSLAGLCLAGIKTYIVFSIVSAFFVYSIVQAGKIRWRYLVIVCLIIILFFGAYDRYIDVFVPKNYDNNIFTGKLVFLQRPYIYFVGSWPAMNNVVIGNVPSEPVTGLVTLDPFWKLLGNGLGLIEPVQPNLPFVDIGSDQFNVYSFVGEVYYDFGFLGVLILSMLVGFLSTGFYLLAMKRGGFWGYPLIAGVFMFVLFFSFFAYYFKFNLLILLAYIFLINIISFRLKSILKNKKGFFDAQSQSA